MARYLVMFHPGDPTPDRMKYIDDASDAPDANDDAATLGVTVGSLWIDTTNSRTYICEDASTGAAVWTELTAGGDTDSLHTDLSVSGTHTIDRADGATHDLTLTGNATAAAIAGAVAGKATDWRLIVRQDGTGNRTLDLDTNNTITWVGGSAPTLQTAANAVDTIGLLTVDDGTTYLGYHASSSGGVSSLDDLDDVDAGSPAVGEGIFHDGTEYVLRNGGRHYHVVGEPVSFDGTATVYYLANEAEELTVAAFDKDGDRVGITHDGAELDKVTFDSAPAAGTGWFDYVAAL